MSVEQGTNPHPGVSAACPWSEFVSGRAGTQAGLSWPRGVALVLDTGQGRDRAVTRGKGCPAGAGRG